MRKLNYLKSAVASLCLLFPSVALADQISISEFPVLAAKDGTGAFPDLIRAMRDDDGNPFDVTVVPFLRSLKMVSDGESIAHMPLLDPETGTQPGPGLVYSDVAIYEVPFSIFYNSSKPVTADQIAAGGLKVEILAAHEKLFTFGAETSTCLPCTMKKVNGGRIDAFVFATVIGGKTIDGEGLKNISSAPYKNFPSRFVIREGDAKTNAMLTASLQRLADAGELDALLAPMRGD